MTNAALETYLQDHQAGAAMGAELAARMSKEYPQPPYGAVLAELSREVRQDKETLDGMADRLGVQSDPLKQAAGWVAEKASRLKLTDAAGNTDLKRLLEFEIMALGIEGKLALWTALREVAALGHADLDAQELAGLAKRAEEQHASLEGLRRTAAATALGGER